MLPLSAQTFAANAYRTLGLSASAGQAEIDAAARRMRIWPDPARIPATPWDLLHIGPVGRTRSDLTLAVSLLHEPGTRLEHRLLWYHDAKAPAAGADFDALPDSPTRRHDVALIALHGSFAEDPAITNMARWSRVIREVEALADDQEYRACIEALERDGNFEKRATAAETASAVAGLPAALVSMLADRARAALDSDDFAGCARVASLMRTSRPEHSREALHRLLNAIEDILHTRRSEMDRDLRDKLETRHEAPKPYYAANGTAALGWSKSYDRSIRPLRALLEDIAGADDADRVVRARSACGALLQLLALGWEWAGLFCSAERTLLDALDLARGSAFEAGILQDLNRCRPLAERERQTEPVLYAIPIPAEEEDDDWHGVIPPVAPHNRQVRQRQAAAGGSGTEGTTGVAQAVEDTPKRPGSANPAARRGRRIVGWTAGGVVVLLYGLLICCGVATRHDDLDSPSYHPGMQPAPMSVAPPQQASPPEVLRQPRVSPEDWMSNPTTNRSISAFGETSHEQ
jgi:hypothetical protein